MALGLADIGRGLDAVRMLLTAERIAGTDALSVCKIEAGLTEEAAVRAPIR